MTSGRRRQGTDDRGRLRPTARSFLVLAAIALILAFVVPVTIAGTFRRLNPEWALKFGPWDARARAAISRRSLMRTDGRPPIRQASAQAFAAYRHDPLAVDAITAVALATALSGNEAKATRLFRYIDRLTRREPETQLWLIEQEVRRNDIRAALTHYDVALRTNPRMRDLLYPVLISASSEQPIAREVNRLLATRPGWDRDFLTHIAYRGADPGAMVQVSRGLLRPDVAEDREILLILLRRLVALNRYDLAWRVHDEIGRQSAASRALLRDGNFASDGALPPFDWQFAAQTELIPERRPRADGRGYALYLPADSATEGEAARQLLRLPSGAYELQGVAGDVPADPRRRPVVSISCAAQSGAGLVASELPQAPTSGRGFSVRFAVPASCAYQWISIRVRGNPEEEDAIPTDAGPSPWIAALALRAA